MLFILVLIVENRLFRTRFPDALGILPVRLSVRALTHVQTPGSYRLLVAAVPLAGCMNLSFCGACACTCTHPVPSLGSRRYSKNGGSDYWQITCGLGSLLSRLSVFPYSQSGLGMILFFTCLCSCSVVCQRQTGECSHKEHCQQLAVINLFSYYSCSRKRSAVRF